MEEREGTANTTPLRRRPRPSYVEETTPETTDQSTLRTRERTLRRKGPFQSHGSHNSDESFAEDDHVSPSPSLRQGRTLATDSCGGAATGSPAPRRSSRSRRTTNTYQLRARKNSPSQQERIKKTGRDGSLNLNYLDSTSANSTPRTKPTVDIQKKIISSGKPIMSSAGKWREEQVLVICPGSRTTMAQLGCNELTPPTHRLQTRMFKDGDGWRPYHTYKRSKIVNGVETEEWVEDVDSDEGAVWPIQGGRIVNMEAFLAFLDHVHGMLTTTYHNTPIMLMASPQWLRPDCETIAQYIFEKTRTPALCLIHSAIATQYGLKQPSMTVVDIGYEKVDVTAIHDGRVVNHVDVGPPVQERAISGGEVFTRRLQKLLEGKGFTYEMAEQLKKSSICEVLTYAGAEEDLFELPRGDKTTGGAAKEDGDEPGKDATKATDVDPSTENGDDANDEGVLDVASIVTSGQTKEFLAKKEQEKKKGKKGKTQEPAEQTKLKQPNSKRARNTFVFEEVVQEEVTSEKQETTNGSAQAPAAAAAAAVDGPSAQPAEGETSTSAPADASGAAPDAPPQPPADQPMGDALSEAPKEEASTQEPPKEASTEEAPKQEEQKPEEPKPEVATAITEVTGAVENSTEHRAKRVRRDIEVGLERFTFAERDEIDRIVTAIYRAIQGVDDMYMRPACWDNLVFVGNGSRLKGLKDNILQTLNARHLVSPSTATMFTSELPSNVATPTGTGSQTPTGSVSGAPHQLAPSGGVNPLLQAATTASSLGVAAPQTVGTPAAGSETGGPTAATTHHFHSQTPTSIKTLGLPTYLQEWTKNGFEESMFLGAQVAARIVFCLHSNMDAHGIEAQRLASLSRVDYNELGPKGIRTHSMLQ